MYYLLLQYKFHKWNLIKKILIHVKCIKCYNNKKIYLKKLCFL